MKFNILCISLIIVVFSFPSICFSELDSNVWVALTPLSYYNKKTLTKSSDIISVWTYNIVTDYHKEEMIKIVKKKHGLEESIKYQNYDHDLILWKFNCMNRQHKMEQFINFDDKGHLLDHQIINEDWRSIVPDSHLEKLYEKVCGTKKPLKKK